MWARYNAQDLEREYSPSSKVTNYPALIAEYAARSAAVATACDIDFISYGSHPDETIAVIGPPMSPVLHIFIHGGYWQELSWRESLFIAPACAQAGHRFAAINYSLAPKASLRQIIAQCKSAVAALVKRAEASGARPILILSGSSAGAHLAASLAACDWSDSGVSGEPVDAVILLSGIYDLEPLLHTTVNIKLGLTRAEADDLSPIRGTPRRLCPPIIAWGENETDEFKRQSLDFAAWWQRGGNKVKGGEIAARNHFDLPFDLGDPLSGLGNAALCLAEGRRTCNALGNAPVISC